MAQDGYGSLSLHKLILSSRKKGRRVVRVHFCLHFISQSQSLVIWSRFVAREAEKCFLLDGYMDGLNKISAYSVTISCLCSSLFTMAEGQPSAVALSLQYGTWSGEDQPAIWWQVGYIGFLSLWRLDWSAFPGLDVYSGYGFACSACHPSAWNIIGGFPERLIHNLGSANSITSDQRPRFSAKAIKNLVGEHEIHWSCHML